MDLLWLRTGLAQLAAIIASSATLLSQPRLAIAVALFAAINFAFAAGSSLAFSYLLLTRPDDALPANFKTLLATYLGGAICFSVMLLEAARFLP